MTVSSTTTRVSYSGNGATVAFPVPFYFLASAHLLVVLRSSAGVETTQVLGTNYTVTGAGVASGGTVTMTAAPAAGATLLIIRNAPYTQETDFLPNDRLPAESLEQTVDKLTMLTQQLEEASDRSVKFPLTDSTSISSTLPNSSDRALKYLKFSATGAVLADNINSNKDYRNVKDFGAIGNGSDDDTAAINATITAAGIGGTVFFPKGTYFVSSKLTMLANQAFVGEGGQNASIIKKGFNGDLIDMVGYCHLEDLSFDGNGASYTGRGIYIASGVAQVITDCRVFNSYGMALEWQATSGSGTMVTNFTADRISAFADQAVIKLGENYPTNVLRFLSNIWLSSGKFDLTNTVAATIEGFFCRGFITGPTFNVCAVNKIANGRVSNPGTLTLSMADSSITNVPISGTTNLTSCQGLMLANCQFDTLTIDNSTHVPASGGVAATFICDRQRSYTCTWNQATGVGPSLGNGSLTTTVTYNGFLVHVYFRLVMGSTTTFGDGTAGWQFSLPRLGTNVHNQYIPGAYMRMNSNIYNYVGVTSIGAAEQVFTIGYGAQIVRAGWPYTWASGDVIEISFDYLSP